MLKTQQITNTTMSHSLRLFISMSILFSSFSLSMAQDMELTLQETIKLAKQNSFEAFRSKNLYLSKELDFQGFKTEFLPKVNLDMLPFYYNRSIQEQYNSTTKEYEPAETQRLTSSLALRLNQKVGFTGGDISVYSGLERSQKFRKNGNSLDYISTPLSFTYRQNFSKINEYKWKAKIEPLKFEQAKKGFIEESEGVALTTVRLYFDLLSSQMNHKVAELNKQNADSLLSIGNKRMQLASISVDELLNLELKKVNAENNMERAIIRLEDASIELCEFLELDHETNIKCIEPKELSLINIESGLAQQKIMLNNPDLLSLKEKLMYAQKQLLQTKRNKFNVDMVVGVGFNQNKENFSDTYKDLLNRQNFRVSMNLPILDWRENKRNYQKAKLNEEIVQENNRKEKERLYLMVQKNVKEFNMKHREVFSAFKADSIAQIAYVATKERFMRGKASVMSVNESYRSMYSQRNNYINALRNYWQYYFTMRKLCLYDFEGQKDLMDQFESLLK